MRDNINAFAAVLISLLALSTVSFAQDTSTGKPDEPRDTLAGDEPATPEVDVSAIFRWGVKFKGRPFDSEFEGFRMFPGRDWKQFSTIGFRPGDVLKEIDGVALSDPKISISDFPQLSRGETVSVVIERDGRLEALAFKLRQPTRDDYREEISRKDLFEASRDGDLERVQELIDAGADVNDTTTGHGMPVLAIAVDQAWRDNGQVAVVELLISHGAKLDTTDSMGRSLLIHALTKGSAVVEVLLEAGIDVNARDDFGRTALWYAMSDHDDEVFDLLLEYGADVALLPDGGSVAMQSAIANRHLDRVARLLDLGVDVNARDGEGQTALFTAIDNLWSPSLEAVRTLLERGAIVNIEDNFGNTPLSMAKNNLEEFLLSEKAQMRAARKGKLFNTTPEMVQQDKRDYEKIVSLLEQAGAREALPAERSLIHSARTGDLEQVAEFIGAGEDIDAVDPKNGFTPLLWAVFKGHDEIVGLLLENGADPNVVGQRGETALLVAAMEKAPPETYSLLLEHGADPNYQDGSGSSALMYAALYAPIETVQALLDAGADPDLETDGDGYTASYFAAMAMRMDVLELLAAAGR
ncbi:MAG TPA: ankyrin repeat domain-containing protein [Woeseiaceae bacterium]|nr:ankyrin repeat domain-containing protein [Woeseiaceae bacterium]